MFDGKLDYCAYTTRTAVVLERIFLSSTKRSMACHYLYLFVNSTSNFEIANNFCEEARNGNGQITDPSIGVHIIIRDPIVLRPSLD
jgi:hypothetical protein